MRDTLNIGPTPSDEPCEQVPYAHVGYAKAECRAFVNQLRRVFGTEPKNTVIDVRAENHEFGTYLEVVVYYDSEDKASVDYAYNIEAHTPERWDTAARYELAAYNLRVGRVPAVGGS